MIMDKKSFFVISGVLSISFYLAVCFALLFYINSPKVKKFDSLKKSTVLNLELISLKSDKMEVVKKSEKKVSKIVKKSTSKSSKKASNLKSLFKNVKTTSKKIVKKSTNIKKGSIDPSRFKSKFEKQKKRDNSSDISKLLSSKKNKSNISKKSSGTKGETHEYYSKIKDILWQRWNPKFLEAGLKVKVLVMISNSGVFDYKIIKYSQDERFDESLKEFLESQKNEVFPNHSIGSKVDIIINFESEG